MDGPPSAGTVLIAGASRGLGCAMAAEFVGRGWSAIGTVREQSGTPLHDLAKRHHGKLHVERLDVTASHQIAALRDSLGEQRLDILFVNAGTTTRDPLARSAR